MICTQNTLHGSWRRKNLFKKYQYGTWLMEKRVKSAKMVLGYLLYQKRPSLP